MALPFSDILAKSLAFWQDPPWYAPLLVLAGLLSLSVLQLAGSLLDLAVRRVYRRFRPVRSAAQASATPARSLPAPETPDA